MAHQVAALLYILTCPLLLHVNAATSESAETSVAATPTTEDSNVTWEETASESLEQAPMHATEAEAHLLENAAQPHISHVVVATLTISDPADVDVLQIERAMMKALRAEDVEVNVDITGFFLSLEYDFTSPVDANKVAMTIAANLGVNRVDVDVKHGSSQPSAAPIHEIEAVVKIADVASANAIKGKASSMVALDLELDRTGVTSDASLRSPPLLCVQIETQIIGAAFEIPTSTTLAEVGTLLGGTVNIISQITATAAPRAASGTHTTTISSRRAKFLVFSGSASATIGLLIAMVAFVLPTIQCYA